MDTKKNRKFIDGFNPEKFLVALETPNMDLDTPEMQYIIKHKMCNAFDWWPYLTNEQVNFLKKNPSYGLSLFLPAATQILKIYKENTIVGRRIEPTKTFVAKELKKLEELTPVLNGNVWWDAFPECDSSGYEFPGEIYAKRLRFKSRVDAYQKLKSYILNQNIFRDFRKRKKSLPKVMAISGLMAVTPYLYEWGMDLGLVEICIDSLSDIHPVIAMQRGIARQYNKKWGLDISHWRMVGPTMYNDKMQLISGWSENYLERNLYLAYMSGANFIRIEEVVSRNETTSTGEAGKNCAFVLSPDKKTAIPTPLGRMLEKFTRFTLSHGKERGETYVPVALMIDYYSGWQPKSNFKKDDTVWFGQIPFNDGDYMLDNFMNLVYEGYHRSGTMDGAPYAIAKDYDYTLWEGFQERKATAIYEKLLSEGFDARPYESISTAIFGDSFDFVLSNATCEILKKYKAVILLGEIKIRPKLAAEIVHYVEDGGTLVINVKQSAAFDRSFLGVSISREVKEDNSSKCLACGHHFGESFKDGNNEEPWYQYPVVKPLTAKGIAKNDLGDFLLTENRYRKGRVILDAPYYGYGKRNKKSAVRIVKHYIHHLMDEMALVEIEGKDITYIINRKKDGFRLMLLNNHNYAWSGTIKVHTGRRCRVIDLLGQKRVSAGYSDGKLSFKQEIEPFCFILCDISSKGDKGCCHVKES
ncbi:MAG: hypothetical protein V2A65_07730 [Candidatus Omnitrophota bacterium]